MIDEVKFNQHRSMDEIIDSELAKQIGVTVEDALKIVIDLYQELKTERDALKLENQQLKERVFNHESRA